ncbi:hypothetical protein RQM47_17090 [Rubrivirga sp. S365]|uniref:GH39 family glycosyl hydrolase n=1 Tax=Rubrivirga sp. S365 TaxID=3076080 RepID=UPI0028C5995F|nr:hypothetical protein [Rubrivirga sp. S365]MDT7858368.1 hypothetical protein [Rubrivirga sp. S365]
MPLFRCDLAQTGELLPHIWSHTVGSGHATLALRADWQAQLRRCRDELGVRHVRFHGIMDDDMGTLVDQAGELVDSFFNADQIMDFLVSIGMRPFVELSLMPEALASGPDTVFHYKGNVTPPGDVDAWGGLIERLLTHWVERYGADEVRQWFFEVWNEPNQSQFWTGTQADYFELYRATAQAVKRVDSELRVGGPATSKNAWVEDLVAFCEAEDLPLDFVSTHHYPTDAFGAPDDDTRDQLSKSTRGILREQALDAARQAGDRPVYYTEWNASSNPFYAPHDRPYAAAFVMKSFLDVADVVQGYSFWTFTDLFEEVYFDSTPFKGKFGLLTIHGIAKPTYRAFELLHRAGTERLLVDGMHPTVDRWVTRHDDGRIVVLLTNHALPDHDIETASVRLVLDGAPDPSAVTVERVDEDHANARRLWESMGEPDYLSAEQVESLHAASGMVPEPIEWSRDGEALVVEIDLPAHAVASITLAP